MLTLARVVICSALFCLPFFVFIAASGKPENGMWLIFPFFGAVPAILGALLLFAPLEGALDARGLGWLKNAAVPLAGAVLPLAFMAVVAALSGGIGKLFAGLAKGDGELIGAVAVWGVLGAAWGGLWRLTAWIAASVRPTGRA